MDEERSPLEELAEKAKKKIAVGKFIFDKMVLPKAKEAVKKAKSTVEALANEVKDRMDPMSGLARHAKDAKADLRRKGFSAKNADDIVKKTVESSLKDKSNKERNQK